LEHTAIIVSI